METEGGDVIFTHSGVMLSSAQYESTSNKVTLRFTTDSTTNQYGWRIYWEEVVPPVETTTTSTSTTTPPCKCLMIIYDFCNSHTYQVSANVVISNDF